MIKITIEAVSAFIQHQPFHRGNTRVTIGDRYTRLYLQGNNIALFDRLEHKLYINPCGRVSATIKRRLNGLSGVSIRQHKREWFLNNSKKPMVMTGWTLIET